jgi:murein DD-endopeptidase MepM/ murein hydrolase activator NlpD
LRSELRGLWQTAGTCRERAKGERVKGPGFGRCLGLVVAAWFVLWLPITAAPPGQSDPEVHVVQAGETLFLIAQHYGTTIDAIVAANALLDPDQLSVGQRLVIPGTLPDPERSTVYVVQPGDTLALIARRHHTDVQAVSQLNRLSNPNLIYVGQRLAIPVAEQDDARPTGGQVHVVQAGETIAAIAARYGVALWSVAQVNGIANPNVIQVGQRLLIPTGEGQSSLPDPFVSVHIVPAVAAQGQTVQVWVETDGEVELSGAFDGTPLVFVGEQGQYRSLFGIYVMATPGPYALELRAAKGVLSASVHNMLQVVSGAFGVEYLSFSEEKSALLEPTLVAQEMERLQQVTTQVTMPGLWSGPFALPLADTSSVSAAFGTRRSYDGGPADSYHSGVDYSAPEGTPVLCPAQGRVVLAEPLAVRGSAVIVDHGRGVMSCYWHLSRIDVTVGQEVQPGDVLGLVGNTGLSTGAHLHWEMRVMGVQVDPLQWAHESIQ